MQRLALVAAMLLAPLALAQYTDTTKLASLNPAKVTVTTKYSHNGVIDNAPQPICSSQVTGDTCLPKIQAGDTNNGVVVTYSVNQTWANSLASNASPKIVLKACYTNASTFDRPWRKANPIIAKDKACGFAIASGTKLPFPSGIATWHPSDLVPYGTYYVRAYVYCQVQGQPTGTTAPCAYGNSNTASGNFQVNRIDSRPHQLWSAVAGLVCVGPVLLASFFLVPMAMGKKVSK